MIWGLGSWKGEMGEVCLVCYDGFCIGIISFILFMALKGRSLLKVS